MHTLGSLRTLRTLQVLPAGAKCVKVLIESCEDCHFHLSAGCIVVTSTVSMWLFVSWHAYAIN